MRDTFNPKAFVGKSRIYRPVTGAPGILRLWVWDSQSQQYQSPDSGKAFDARRYEPGQLGGKIRVKRYFATLAAARSWQRHLQDETVTSGSKSQNVGPTFQEVYEAFFQKKVSVLAKGTQENYARYVRLYFQEILPMRVYDITPQFIDSWIDWLRSTRDQFHQSKLRTSFDHELSVMRSVLLYYRNYYDDPHYQFPVKSRHAEDSRIGKAPPKTKDLTEAEFLRFHARLSETKLGCLLAPMATVQFYQALRISEAAGLFFEDLNLNFRNPSESTIRVSRHVIYLRGAHSRTEILPGFKNSGGGEYAIKELHLFPESFEALKSVFKVGARGIVFSTDGKTPLSYRKIQNAYDLAFRKAGLPYRGTHVLRHGGCRRVYNATGGDIALAQQLLGNSDLESTLVYAKRDRNALKTLVQSKWQ